MPWSLLVKAMPKSKHQDIDFIVDQLDWEKNMDPNFKDNHYLEPVLIAEPRSRQLYSRFLSGLRHVTVSRKARASRSRSRRAARIALVEAGAAAGGAS